MSENKKIVKNADSYSMKKDSSYLNEATQPTKAVKPNSVPNPPKKK